MPEHRFQSIQLGKQQWGYISAGLHENHCVLVLGPYFHKDPSSGKPLLHLLANELADELGDVAVFNRDDLAYVSKLYDKENGTFPLNVKVKKFYSRHADSSELAKDITQLPFHLIINTTPDQLLAEAYRSQAGAADEGFYFLGRKQTDIYNKLAPQPYIYNLFGCITDLGSLVLTQDQQMAFVQSVIQRESALPDSLVNELKPDKIYIFLGFDYENWYLRVLLYLLKLNDQVKFAYGMHDPVKAPTSATKVFFASQYKMAFVEMDDHEFIQAACKQVKGGKPVKENIDQKELFFLCDPEDESFLRKLDKQLAPLKRRHHIKTKNNLDILSGTDTEEAIKAHIQSADFILPIVTSDLLASDLYDQWIAPLLERHKKGALVVPLLMRPCQWDQSEFTDLQQSLLPRNQQAVSRWKPKEDGYQHIVEELEKMI